ITMVQTPMPEIAPANLLTFGARPMDGGGGGFSPDALMQPGYPYLTIAPTNSNELLITVINTNPATYYLQMTPILGDVNYPFAIIQNGAVGQTNFLVSIGYPNEFFRALMSTNDPGSSIAIFIDSPANGATVQ